MIFYYAGHGVAGDLDGDGPAGYILPGDAEIQSSSLADNTSLIQMDKIFEALVALNYHHTLLILDCCFAGAFNRIQKTRATFGLGHRPMTRTRFNRYTNHKAFQVLVSAGPSEKAADWISDRGKNVVTTDGKAHSPFAKALIDALSPNQKVRVKPKGKNLGDGVITSFELFLHLHDQVERLTRTNKQFKAQNPDLFPMAAFHEGGQFVFCDPRYPLNQLNWAKRKGDNPYKGLLQFDIEDSGYFFGRETDIEALTQIMHLDEKLENPNPIPKILMITGPSGSGKSSLVKAGLLPHFLDQGYELFQLRPGDRPWKLNAYRKDEVDSSTPKEEERFSWQVLQEGSSLNLNRHLDPTKKQVLYLDQYEEVFTECDEKERKFLEQQLKALFNTILTMEAGPESIGLRIVLSMRSDFEWQLELSDFGKLYWEAKEYAKLYRLATLGLENLRSALVNPALMLAYEFEEKEDESLVDMILEDLNYQASALPLLSYTMQEFVQANKKKRTQKRKFTINTYLTKLGGVSGVLSRRMDRIYESLAEGTTDKVLSRKQSLMRNIFLRMVRLNDGEYSRRRVFRTPGFDELLFSENPLLQNEVEAILDTLMKDQIISIGGDETGQPFVELIHDSLINSWTQGKLWIQQFGQENITLQRQLWQAAVDKKRRKKDAEEAYANVMRRQQQLDPKFFEEEDVVTSSSLLWDNNPRLMQILNQIDFSQQENAQNDPVSTAVEAHKEDLALFAGFQAQQEEYYSKLFEDRAIEGIEQLFEKAIHWLNKVEIRFIIDSWLRKEDRFRKITQERDEAQRSARASRNAVNILQKERTDPTLALRMAEANYLLHPHEPAPLAVFHQMISNKDQQFYKSFQAYKPIGASEKKYQEAMGNTGEKEAEEKLKKLEAREKQMKINYPLEFVGPNGKKTSAANEEEEIALNEKFPNLEMVFPIQVTLTHTQTVITIDGEKEMENLLMGRDDLWGDGGLNDVFKIDDSTEIDLNEDSDSDSEEEEEVNVEDLDWEEVFTINFPVEIEIPSGEVVEVISQDALDTLMEEYTEEASLDMIYPIEVTLMESDEVRTINSEADIDLLLLEYSNESGSGHVEETEEDVLGGFDDDVLGLHEETEEEENDLDFDLVNSMMDSLADLKETLSELEEVSEDNEWYPITPMFDEELIKAIYAPDGQSILIGYGDGMVKLWDLEGEELQSFVGHNTVVFALAFSTDGQTILTGSYDKTAKLWALDGKEKVTFTGHEGEITCVAFSSDGLQVATASKDQTVRIWDLDGTEKVKISDDNDGFSALAFSPHGEFLLTADYRGQLKLWDLDGGLVQHFEAHLREISSIAFSPDGDHFLSGSLDGSAVLWDLSGRGQQYFSDENSYVYAVAFSPDGQTILTGHNSNVAKLWDLEGKELRSFTGHNGNISSLAFAPDGKSILTGSNDKTARLWQLDMNWQHRFHCHEDEIQDLAIASNGEFFVTASKDKTAKVWDIDGNLLQTLADHKNGVKAVAITPDNNTIITASRDNTLKIWDSKGKLETTISNEDNLILDMAIAPDGQSVLIGTWKEAKLFDLKGNVIKSFPVESGSVDAVAFSPDGKHILTGSENYTVKLWTVEGKEIHQFSEMIQVSFIGISFSPDGKSILTSVNWNDNYLKLWDLSGKQLQSFDGHTHNVLGIAFSSETQYLATASADQSVKLWNLKGKEIHTLWGHDKAVTSIAFHPDGQTIWTASEDGTVIAWYCPWNFMAQNIHAFSKEELIDAGLEVNEAEKNQDWSWK